MPCLQQLRVVPNQANFTGRGLSQCIPTNETTNGSSSQAIARHAGVTPMTVCETNSFWKHSNQQQVSDTFGKASPWIHDNALALQYVYDFAVRLGDRIPVEHRPLAAVCLSLLAVSILLLWCFRLRRLCLFRNRTLEEVKLPRNA